MNNGAYHYQNRPKTNEEKKAWDSFDAAFDLAEEHLGEPIRKIEMNASTRRKIFGEDCDFIWGADVSVNDALLDDCVIFDANDAQAKAIKNNDWFC